MNKKKKKHIEATGRVEVEWWNPTYNSLNKRGRGATDKI